MNKQRAKSVGGVMKAIHAEGDGGELKLKAFVCG